MLAIAVAQFFLCVSFFVSVTLVHQHQQSIVFRENFSNEQNSLSLFLSLHEICYDASIPPHSLCLFRTSHLHFSSIFSTLQLWHIFGTNFHNTKVNYVAFPFCVFDAHCSRMRNPFFIMRKQRQTLRMADVRCWFVNVCLCVEERVFFLSLSVSCSKFAGYKLNLCILFN